MKCSHCGAMVADELKFCSHCGARIQSVQQDEQMHRNIEKEDYGIQLLMRPINPTVPEMATKNPEVKNTGVKNPEVKKMVVQQKQQLLSKLKSVQCINQERSLQIGEVKLFFKFMKDFIKNPLMTKAEIDERLNTKNACIYLGVLVALNTLMSVVVVGVILKGMKDLIDVVVYLMSSLSINMNYLTGRIGLSFVIGNLVINIGHMLILTMFMKFIGSKLLKQDINWQELCKYLLAPLGVLVIGKLPVLVVTILSIKVGLVMYVLLMCLVMSIGIITLQNRYGKDGGSIYVIGGLYLLSMSISVLVGTRIMMIF